MSSVGSTSVIGALGSAAVGIAAGLRAEDLSQRANNLQARLRNMEFQLRQVVENIDNREDLIRQVEADQRRLNC